MGKNQLRVFLTAVVALLGVGIASSASAELTIKRTVRCDMGKTVQEVLDKNILGLPMEIQLVGACPGFAIEQDKVVIVPRDGGVCPGATITGTIFLTGATGVQLMCLEIASEDGPGIDAQRSSLQLEDVEVQGNEGAGLESTDNSRIEMARGSVVNNGDHGVIIDSKGMASFENTNIDNNSGHGITVIQDGLVSFYDGSIQENAGVGIRVEELSGAYIEGSLIANNDSAGVLLRSGSRGDLTHTDLVDNGGSGLGMTEGTTATVRGGSVTGNGRSGIFVAWHSVLRNFWGTLIMDNASNGITITRDSAVQVGTGASIPPNGSGFAVACLDGESSIDFQDGVDVDFAFVDCENIEF